MFFDSLEMLQGSGCFCNLLKDRKFFYLVKVKELVSIGTLLKAAPDASLLTKHPLATISPTCTEFQLSHCCRWSG